MKKILFGVIFLFVISVVFFLSQNAEADLTPTYNQSIDQEITIGQNSAGSVEIQIYPSNAKEDFTVTFQTLADNAPIDFEVLPISSVKINPNQNPFHVYMTVAAGHDTPTGTYLVHVTSSSTLNGHLTTRTNTVTVHVVSPDEFFLSASPMSVTIQQGGSAITSITTTAKKTLPNEVLLGAEVEDLNISTIFSGTGELAQYYDGSYWGVHPISGSSLTSTLEISAKPNTPPGTYYVWVSGKTTMQNLAESSSSNYYRHTILITVNVIASQSGSLLLEHSTIPSWIKNTAKWWSEGQTSDSDFASGIGYLVTNKIINLDSRGTLGSTIVVSGDMQIPSWIKNDANYWALGNIDDHTFLQGIQYMLDNDIITFSTPVKTSPATNNNQQSKLQQVLFHFVDSDTGYPVDTLVIIGGGATYMEKETDRDGSLKVSLPQGSYTVTADSDKYQRSTSTFEVKENAYGLATTIYLKKFSSESTTTQEQTTSPNTSPSQSSPTPQVTPPSTTQPSTTSQGPQVSISPTSTSFTFNYNTDQCQQLIAPVTLTSNQKGTWVWVAEPPWMDTRAIVDGKTSLTFDCNTDSNISQTVNGDATFTFTSDNTYKQASVTIHITGQIIGRNQ